MLSSTLSPPASLQLRSSGRHSEEREGGLALAIPVTCTPLTCTSSMLAPSESLREWVLLRRMGPVESPPDPLEAAPKYCVPCSETLFETLLEPPPPPDGTFCH